MTLSAKDLADAVYERLDGNAPTYNGEVILRVIVVEVLLELVDRGYLERVPTEMIPDAAD